MERKEAIRSAYRLTGGNSFYDGMITCSTLSGKAVCRLVWAMNKAENDAYLEKAMSGIPEHFSGKLLEVPVGTGILTMPVYQTIMSYYVVCKAVTSFREIEEMEENLILPIFRKLRFVDCNKPFWRKLMYKAFVRAKCGCDKWHDYEMTCALR